MERVLSQPDWKDEYRVQWRVEWKAFELTPREVTVTPADLARKQEIIARTWPRLVETARESFGIVGLNRGPLGIDTRSAHVGAKIARRKGTEDAYHLAAFRAYWHQAQDLSDPAVLKQVADAAGLDGEEFLRALEEPALVEEVMSEETQAHRIGITGVPATVIEGRHLIPGCLPPAELDRVLRGLVASLNKKGHSQ